MRKYLQTIRGGQDYRGKVLGGELETNNDGAKRKQTTEHNHKGGYAKFKKTP